jgi:NAD(P)H-flavin reductase
MKKKEICTVIRQKEIGDGIFSMWIQTENIGKEAKPGQFVSVYSKDGSKLLPRPISLCEIDRENSRLRLVYRVTGAKTGTEEFSRLKAGDTIPVIGPLGNGFPVEKAEGKRAFLMGGGIGVPPILELAKQMQCEKKQIVVGYRNAQTFLKEEFEAAGELYISTEDGSVGTKGNVMDAIQGTEIGSGYHLCLWSDTDASGYQTVCRGKWYRMLYLTGRAHGMRYRCLPGLCLQIKRKRCTQQRE